MINHSSYCIVFIVLSVLEAIIIEAYPQDFGFAQQNQYHRQGSIDEFLALKPVTTNPNEPCIPLQFYPPRNKRSPHFQKNMLRPVYPVNIYQQTIHNVVPIANPAKPPYNSYGGYYCGNYKPQHPIQQPVHNNFWSHFSNGFGGIFGTNTNVVNPDPIAAGSNMRPVHEATDHNNNPNEVK